MERVSNMKKNKIILLISIVTVLLIGAGSVALAATEFKTPAEIIAGLTGKSVDDVTAARQAGQTYGAQASEAGKLDEFKAARLDLYKQNLDQAVADKRITQEQADKLYDAMKLRMESCDGTGSGAGSGLGMMGQRRGTADGSGLGNGAGLGSRGMNRSSGLGCGGCR
jgi:hypothetical protein